MYAYSVSLFFNLYLNRCCCCCYSHTLAHTPTQILYLVFRVSAMNLSTRCQQMNERNQNEQNRFLPWSTMSLYRMYLSHFGTLFELSLLHLFFFCFHCSPFFPVHSVLNTVKLCCRVCLETLTKNRPVCGGMHCINHTKPQFALDISFYCCFSFGCFQSLFWLLCVSFCACNCVSIRMRFLSFFLSCFRNPVKEFLFRLRTHVTRKHIKINFLTHRFGLKLSEVQFLVVFWPHFLGGVRVCHMCRRRRRFLFSVNCDPTTRRREIHK